MALSGSASAPIRYLGVVRCSLLLLVSACAASPGDDLHVAHGRGSTDGVNTAVADRFSNIPESHQSSLGMMRTAEAYVGDYGRSFRLDGLEPGFNDNVRRRDIVMHPWEGSRAEWVAREGEARPTWGCPAIDDREAPAVVDVMSGGALMYFWYPDGDWSERSDYR